jgi:hypothetical protein
LLSRAFMKDSRKRIAAALVAAIIVVLALMPSDRGRRQRVLLTDESTPPRFAELDPARDRVSVGEAIPPEPPRHTLPPPPHAPPEEPTEEPTSEPQVEEPIPEDLLVPPGAPDLPIWAYDGALEPEPGAPTEVPHRFDPDAPTRAVQDPLRDNDALVGLDLRGAGAIITAIRKAVRAHTPSVSVATYRARITSDGELLGIDVVSFAGGSVQMWQAAADEAFASLRGWRGDMPGHLASGAEVVVRIEQSLERPSGMGRKDRSRAEKVHPLAKGVPKPGRIHHRLEPIVSVADMLPPDLARLGDPETMLPPLNADGSGVAIRFDLSDIGTHKVRVVHARTSVRPLRPGTGGPRR